MRHKFLLFLIVAESLDIHRGLSAVPVVGVRVFAVDVVRPVANEVVGVENGAGTARHFEEAAVRALNELGALVRVRPDAGRLGTPDGRTLRRLLQRRRRKRIGGRGLHAAMVILLQATLTFNLNSKIF